jgi:hypothetical protein
MPISAIGANVGLTSTSADGHAQTAGGDGRDDHIDGLPNTYTLSDFSNANSAR